MFLAKALKDWQIICIIIIYRLLEEKEDKITQLEDRMSEVNREDGDKAHLLESIQSNKTALSRALTQNKELKHQLAELQNGFVKMVSI